MSQSQVPPLAADYFTKHPTRPTLAHPVIAEQFVPGAGWKRYSGRKYVSASWLRKMQREGVTAVALRAGQVTADFTVRELLYDGPRAVR